MKRRLFFKTTHKHTISDIQKNKKRFQMLFDNTNSGVAVYEVINDGSSGKDYIIKDFNRTSLQIEGLTKQEVIGKSLYDLRPNIDDYGLIGVFQKVWQTGEPGYYPAAVYSDTTFESWYENRVFKLPSGEIVAVYDDVTERKLMELSQVEYQQKLLKANQELEAALEEIISIEEELRSQYEELEKRGHELANSKHLLEDIISFLPDATFAVDKQGIILFWNKAMEIMSGAKAEEMVGRGNYEYALPFYGERRPLLLDLVLDYDEEKVLLYPDIKIGANNSYMVEYFYVEIGNTKRYLSFKAAPLLDTEGKVIGAVESIRDVTAYKDTENQMRYNAEHDSTTGLYNRRRFEKEMKDSNNLGSQLGLIVSDVDGLKLVNDTLGHQEGDRLLMISAQILREASTENSLIARIGGDEFCILIRNQPEAELYTVITRIKQAVDQYNQKSPIVALSISSGVAYSHGDKSMTELFKEAEEKMYYDKLMHNQSTRSKVVDVLMKALEARDFITEGHTERLGELVELIARSLKMPEHRINSLRLFAHFHDIGKVGIADAILFKPDKLTTSEFEEMKKHSEIGFRISQCTPDLGHISDWILKHHEWWNGSGYPLGLAGEEIPLECRILAIADAYDSMSNDRPYRKALRYEERIAELKKFSGEQFDPQLVEVFLDLLKRYSILRMN